MPQVEKVARANVVIENNGTKQDLHDRALQLIPRFPHSLDSVATLFVAIFAMIPAVTIAALLDLIIRNS